MKIAIAQINPVIGDFEYNFSRIKHYADKAKAHSCDMVVFSELVISGYPPRDLLEKKDFIEANLSCLSRLVDEIRGIGVICGFVDKNPVDEGKSLYNSAALFENGKILHRVNKRLLPTYDVFDESRYFEAGTECTPYKYKGEKIGITICEDVWNDKDVFKKRIYHINPVDLMVKGGASLLVNISASPFHVGKKEFRWDLFGAIAGKYKVPLIFANQVGGNDSILFDGTSAAFDRHGKIKALARDFEEDIIFYDSDEQTGITYEDDIHPVSGSDLEPKQRAHSQPKVPPISMAGGLAAGLASELKTDAIPYSRSFPAACGGELQSVLKALIMGTRDYVVKCGFSKVVLGLSGGIDSALTAFIAAKALGSENVLSVFMPSGYTSVDNFEDTEKLAGNLGIGFEVIPVDGVFKEFIRLLSPSFREGEPDITEQNIQARIRGTILMALSNRQGRLLLSTGNKSELAVGYCTLYGDMNGGLAVISDIPKTEVYGLARFINREEEIIPARIIEKAPSAELKPDQTDQDDLPPYEILDSILKGYIEDLKGAGELVESGFDPKLVEDVISRVDRNEYKRHQAAPGLKVTTKAFGYGRRYPLAQRYTQSIYKK